MAKDEDFVCVPCYVAPERVDYGSVSVRDTAYAVSGTNNYAGSEAHARSSVTRYTGAVAATYVFQEHHGPSPKHPLVDRVARPIHW